MAVSISLAFIALVFVAIVAGENDRNYAYVTQNFTQTLRKCVDFPETETCPNLKITVLPGESLDSTVRSLQTLKKTLPTYATSVNANDACIDAVYKQECLGIAHCVTDGVKVNGVTVDSDDALAQCRKARQLCPDALSKIFLNCTRKAEIYKLQTLTFGTCAIIQDPTGFCPEVKYKRYKSPSLNYTEIFEQMKSSIEPLKGNTTDECYKKVKALACSSLGACSDDGKYLLALYNQEDCNNTVDCIPESNRQSLLKDQLCSDAPNARNPLVKKVSYPTGNENTTGKATSLKDNIFHLVVAVFSIFIAKHLV